VLANQQVSIEYTINCYVQGAFGTTMLLRIYIDTSPALLGAVFAQSGIAQLDQRRQLLAQHTEWETRTLVCSCAGC
jgi:hypothetical protein